MNYSSRAVSYILIVVVAFSAALSVFAAEDILGRPAPVVTISANPSTLSVSGSVTLTWTSQFATSCFAGGAWSGSKSRNGSKVVQLSATSEYTLTCRGRGGVTTSSVTVVVGVPEEPIRPEPPIDPLPPTPTTTPSAPTPTCTLAPSKSSVLTNEPFTITWSTTNADYISDIGGKNNPSGTTAPITIPNVGPYQYSITAYGAGGTAMCSTTVSVSAPDQQATTTPQSICPTFTVPLCTVGSYPTPGNVDANGCIGASRCTLAIKQSAVQSVVIPNAMTLVAGSDYGGTGITGTNAYRVNPPTSMSSATTVTIQNLNLDTRKVWLIMGKLGLSPVDAAIAPPTNGGGSGGDFEADIRGATYGGSVRVTIAAAADQIDATDKTTEVLFDKVLTPSSGITDVRIPLGIWGMRSNLKLIMTLQKTVADSLTYGVVFDSFGFASFGNRPDQGIVNNDPEWRTLDQQEKQLAALATIPITWIHDSIRTTGASWPQAPLLKRVQDQGKKIQLVVGPMDEDYTDGMAARVPLSPQYSAWGFALPFSKINLDLYEKRLKNNLTSYKKAGVDVKAIEVGNELDLVGFNADVPTTRAPTDADYQLFAETYAKFLERTVSIVKRPEFYPNAKIILGSPAIDWSPASGKLDPAKMYAPLRNLNGKNYFALVDGIGIHYYPALHENGSQSMARTKAFLSAIGEPNRPLWVSEWGYANNSFPNASGADRYRAFVTLYDAIVRSESKVVFMTNFALDEFSYPFHLVDQSYVKLPETRFFDHYRSPVPSTVVLDSAYQPATACVTCAARDWFDEMVARVRDYVLITLGN